MCTLLKNKKERFRPMSTRIINHKINYREIMNILMESSTVCICWIPKIRIIFSYHKLNSNLLWLVSRMIDSSPKFRTRQLVYEKYCLGTTHLHWGLIIKKWIKFINDCVWKSINHAHNLNSVLISNILRKWRHITRMRVMALIDM